MHYLGGVVVGTVKDLNDPEGEGRIKVEFPWMDGGIRSAWAPVASMFAGGGRGGFFAPEIDDEALLAFEQGSFEHPFICGYLWNGVDAPPTQDPQLRIIRSVNGHEIALYDPGRKQGDMGYLSLKSAYGDEIKLSNTGIVIRSRGVIKIEGLQVTINERPVAPLPPSAVV